MLHRYELKSQVTQSLMTSVVCGNASLASSHAMAIKSLIRPLGASDSPLHMKLVNLLEAFWAKLLVKNRGEAPDMEQGCPIPPPLPMVMVPLPRPRWSLGLGSCGPQALAPFWISSPGRTQGHSQGHSQACRPYHGGDWEP